MFQRVIPSWSIAAAMAGCFAVGCGGNTASPTTPPKKDSGAPADAAKVDSGKLPSFDAGMDGAGNDGALPPGSILPHGTQLVMSATVTAEGITSDNYAIYIDNMSFAISAMPLTAGSQAIGIGTGDSSTQVQVFGSVVLFWTSINMNTGLGNLSLWTKANGMQALSATTNALSGQGSAAVSADNSSVIYFNNVNATTMVGDIVVASTSGTKTTVATGIELGNANCSPEITFGGKYALASYCTTATVDAGTDVATISSYTGAAWTATTVATGVESGFTPDTAGTEVLVNGPTGLLVYPITGGALATVDLAGGAGAFTSDGKNVVYTTSTNALKRSPVMTPAPVTLVPSGLANIIAFSKDNNWVLANLMSDNMTGLSNLYIASATTAGTAKTLAMGTTGILYGDAFTADSTHATYYTPVDTTTNVGTFVGLATSGSGTAATLGMNVWVNYSTTAAKVVFDDNFDSASNTADLRAVDLAQTSPMPTLLVTAVDAFFFVSPAKDNILYSWSYDPTSSSSGLWVLPAP